MKKKIIYGMMLTACGAIAPQAAAQSSVSVVEVFEVEEIIPGVKPTQFALKAYDNIGLGKVMSTDDAEVGTLSSSNYNAFGLDFGWTFWRKREHSLEANIGLGYYIAGGKFRIPDMTYHYAAPAAADEDGNPYERYMEIKDMSQTTSLGYFNIPIYLEYQYRPLRWLGLHAEAGVGLGFRVHDATSTKYGKVYSYGIFPEYDDLLIDQDYLDFFGDRNIQGSYNSKASMNSFSASIMCGAGFEFYAYEPVSFELGIRYNVGLTNCFNGKLRGNIGVNGQTTAEEAPITYTVKDGFEVKSLADYTTKSKLSPLSLHLGINVRF